MQEKIIQALSTTEGEITAAFRFLDQQKHLWKIEVTKRHEAYVEAKQILKRKELGRTFGHKVDTTVQEEEVRKCKARWQTSEEKLAHVKRWKPRLEHQVRDYLGPRQGLSVQAETEMVKALAFLDQKIASLAAVPGTTHPPSLPEEPNHDQGVGKVQLQDGLKKLLIRWEETTPYWNDQVRLDFERKFIEPLVDQIKTTMQAQEDLARMMQVLSGLQIEQPTQTTPLNQPSSQNQLRP